MSLQLFPTVSNEKISVFSCGHVVPRSNLLCVVVGKGPRGKCLEFKFKNREDESLVSSCQACSGSLRITLPQMDELGQCLFNTVNVRRSHRHTYSSRHWIETLHWLGLPRWNRRFLPIVFLPRQSEASLGLKWSSREDQKEKTGQIKFPEYDNKELEHARQVFYEPQESAEVDGVLREYAIACRQVLKFNHIRKSDTDFVLIDIRNNERSLTPCRCGSEII